MFQAAMESSPSFFSQHPLMVFMNVIQFINLPMMYLSEFKSAAPYSKFAASLQAEEKQRMIPSREGMLIIYIPAAIIAAIYIAMASSEILSQYQMNLPSWMLLVHFLKRTLEVLFLHKYSGSTVLFTAKMIGFVYAFQTLLICCTSNSQVSETAASAGTALFVTGTLGNLYHHYLLASLRPKSGSSDGQKKYVAPKGGFFEYVAAPHYLFELVAWLGIAVAGAQITGYLVFAGMTAYLGARSGNQNAWNKEKFSGKDWPTSRKNMIPFLY